MKKIFTICLVLGICTSSLLGCEVYIPTESQDSTKQEFYKHDIAGYTTVFYKESEGNKSGTIYSQYVVYSNYDKRLYEIVETTYSVDTYHSERIPLTEADGTPRYYVNENSIKDFTGGR